MYNIIRRCRRITIYTVKHNKLTHVRLYLLTRKNSFRDYLDDTTTTETTGTKICNTCNGLHFVLCVTAPIKNNLIVTLQVKYVHVVRQWLEVIACRVTKTLNSKNTRNRS